MKKYLVLLAIAGFAAVTPALADNCPTTANWCSGLYLYDGSGNIRAIGSDTYIYDKLERLKSGTAEAQRGGTSRQDYTYDSFGNRTNASRAAGSVDCLGGCEQSPTIDLGTNHITGSGAVYDDAGNLLSIQSTVNGTTFASTYTYDAGGMTRATAGTDDRQFIYTAEGERIATRNGQTWTWTLRGLDKKVLREVTSLEPNSQPGLPTTNRQWTKDYVWRDGQLLASVTAALGTTTQHFHLDHLGTPRLVTNDNGAQIGIHAYYPFGAELNLGPDAPSGELLKFTGHERDLLASNPNTLDYMHARYAMATMDRILSVDQSRTSWQPTIPLTWNRYVYALDSPIKFHDPDGRETELAIGLRTDKNPVGHSSIIINGKVYSFGTNWTLGDQNHQDWGGDAKKFLDAQNDHRQTELITLKVSDAQEQRLQTFLEQNNPNAPGAPPYQMCGNSCVSVVQNALITTGILPAPTTQNVQLAELHPPGTTASIFPEGLEQDVGNAGLIESTRVVGRGPKNGLLGSIWNALWNFF